MQKPKALFSQHSHEHLKEVQEMRTLLYDTTITFIHTSFEGGL